MRERLTKALIRQESFDDVYERGERLFEAEEVWDLAWRGDRLEARVLGNSEPYYQVALDFSDNGAPVASCTCPYDWGGWCKHQVAAALTALHDSSDIPQRPSLKDLLKQLAPSQREPLIYYLVDQDPHLLELIESFVREPDEALLCSSSSDLSPPDIRSYRGRLQNLLEDTLREVSQGYVEEDILTEPLLEILSEVSPYLEMGEFQAASQLLETITQEYVEAYDELANLGSESPKFERRLDELWIEVVLFLGTELSPTIQSELKLWSSCFREGLRLTNAALRQISGQ